MSADDSELLERFRSAGCEEMADLFGGEAGLAAQRLRAFELVPTGVAPGAPVPPGTLLLRERTPR
ncbi:MAG TPA: hypothetical protein DCM86_12845 [Verrucomicrobiales bacterium]|nr:hypothetical protein [Verrucomicrobiales bacterium]